MIDMNGAAVAVDHAVKACASWHHEPLLVARPKAVQTAHAAAIKPEYLALTAAIPAPMPPTAVHARRRARLAFPVFSQRIEI